MSSGGGRKTVFSGADEADVDALLRATEDEINLKLHTNSHLVSTSPSLDADLTRRFDALKKSHLPVAPPCQDNGEGDNLEARFAKLKGLSGTGDMGAGLGLDPAGESGDSGIRYAEGDEVDVEKEVDKLMQWAKDAVRLDAVKGRTEKDEEEEEEEKDEKEEESCDEEEEGEEGVKAEAKKPKKWFFF